MSLCARNDACAAAFPLEGVPGACERFSRTLNVPARIDLSISPYCIILGARLSFRAAEINRLRAIAGMQFLKDILNMFMYR